MLTPQNFIHILEYELYVLPNDLFSFRLCFGLGTQKFIRIYERKLKKNKKKASRDRVCFHNNFDNNFMIL